MSDAMMHYKYFIFIFNIPKCAWKGYWICHSVYDMILLVRWKRVKDCMILMWDLMSIPKHDYVCFPENSEYFTKG